MSTNSVNRKLAAIFYADIAGYSRHTGRDEVGTHRRAMEVLDFASGQISQSGGKVLRYAGDAILAEFSSAVSAAEAAVSIQNELADRNLDLGEEQRIHLRIGINIGDVIEDRGEVYGDGVNLAARLESVSPEGGICVPASVQEQVAGKLEARFVDAGPQEFKNIERTVHVFHWLPTATSKTAPDSGSTSRRRSDTPSIAVLALANMNKDPELDFLGDGITEDLITALSRIRSFKVISRESTFSYKGTSTDVRQIADDLGVGFVLEGSVRKAGNRVRVTAQLIDADTGHHVWAERYDREMEDIFDLQDEMVMRIASALEPELNAYERERALSKSPENLDAWELYQRALWHMWTYEDENTLIAKELFEKANEADPTFAPAYAYYAYSCYIRVIMGYTADPKRQLEEGMAAARKALQCDDKDAICYFAIGRIHMMQGSHDDAIAALRKSIKLNPNFAQSYHALGFALGLAGELEEAVTVSGKASEISPRDPMLWAFEIVHAFCLLVDGKFEEALEMAIRARQIPNSTGYWCHAVIASALSNLDRIDEARVALSEALAAKPDLTIEYLENTLPAKQPDELAIYLDGLVKAGLGDL